MFRRIPLPVLLCLVVCLSLSEAACSLQQKGGRTGFSDGGRSLFTPLNRSGAFALDSREAESLALKMHARQQGLNNWRDMAPAVSRSLAHVSARPASAAAASLPGLTLSYGQLASSLRRLRDILPDLDSRPELLAREFTWYRIGPDFGCTGYYEPTLRASRTKSAAYPYPLYRKPPDLRGGVPYHTRHAIDRKGALAGRGLEIAWVSSETDAFFLHVQGSGRLLFPDGSVSHALYAGKNNRAYVSLGRVMREQGMLDPDDVSMQSIRRYLLENPGKRAALFDANPSYVFFREAPQGPIGAMGSTLTPWVSTATDRKTLPHGSLAFVVLPLPDAAGKPNVPFYGLTLPQDSGGAIKKNRIDLFCGSGDRAAHTAGYLNARGAVYMLVKK